MAKNKKIIRLPESFLYIVILIYYEFEYLLLKIIPSKKEDSILIMRLDGIGDFIVWLDSAKEFKKHFPNKHLVLLCNVACEAIAKKLPYFDEIIVINYKKLLKNIFFRFKVIMSLKKRGFNQIINMVYSRDFFVQDTLIHNLKASKKVGYDGDYQITKSTLSGFGIADEKYAALLKIKANNWYSDLMPASPQPLPELNRNAEFIRHYSDPSFQSRLPVIPFEIPLSNQKPKRDYVVLFIGAATLRRVWNISNYAEVIKEINPDYEIVLCGGKEDEPLYEEFKKISTNNRSVTDLIGKTTLIELFSIIKNAKFIITNETSASHITVAVGTPSVCILAGAHYGRFQPYSVESPEDEGKKYLPKIANYFMDCYYCNHVCKYIPDKNTTYPCIAKISPQLVIEKMREIENDIDSARLRLRR
jgi:ADP-heptose:LPS heptosyltransferase